MSDTSRQAAQVQAQVHRQLSGVKRLQLALDMSLFARELTLTGLRKQHPDWSESDFKRELLRYAFLPAPLPTQLR